LSTTLLLAVSFAYGRRSPIISTTALSATQRVIIVAARFLPLRCYGKAQRAVKGFLDNAIAGSVGRSAG
jgi:hypothetical protein